VPFKRWVLGAEGMFGFGFRNHFLGYYYEYDAITGSRVGGPEELRMSEGGGWGFNLMVGYRLNPYIECILNVGKQNAGISTDLEDADGNFRKNIYSLTMKCKIPLEGVEDYFGPYIVLGGGCGLYSGHMVLDDVFTDNYGDYCYLDLKYKNTIGYHIIGGVELNPPASSSTPTFAVYLNIRFHFLKYQLQSLKNNGDEISLEYATGEYKNINADGCDLTLGFLIYL
jgi:hypothetical protein